VSLALPPGAKSLCFSCKYYDWAIVLIGKKGNASAWESFCSSAGEFEAGDNVTECEGYRKEE
jgi:hypothetical protein